MDLLRTPVSVVGAGIGGMAAALLLARDGARVTLWERATDSTAVGAGILLHSNGLAVLRGLGLDGALRETGYGVEASVLRRADGTPVSAVRVPDFGPGLDHLLAVRRSALHQVLLDAVRAETRIHHRPGTTVHAARAEGTLEVEGGVTDAGLVVGADGVHSTVRGGGAFGARVRATGRTYLRGLVPRGRDDLIGEYWTPLGLFGGAPVDAGTQYFYGSATAPEIARAVTAGDLAGLRHAWTHALPAAAPILDAVDDVSDLLVNDVARVDCDRWSAGRRVLLGDAAHAMAPTSGQGANSALVDAAVLTLELSAEGSLERALHRYTARRRPAVRRVQDRSDQITRLAHLRSRPARGLRDAVLRLVARRPGTAEAVVRASQQEDPAALLDALRARRAGH